MSQALMGLVSKLDKLKVKSTQNDSPFTQGEEGTFVDTDNIDELDNQGQSILMGLISQLRLGSDLSKITLPTFILEKKSMLERITNFFQIPQILLSAEATEDDLERFVLMTKWYLASWHIAPKAVKKPLNPVLGEIYNCYWDNLPDGSTAYYAAEQTSHHPPKSSYFYLIPEKKIRVDGTIIPKSKFLGNSSAAIMEGWGQVKLGAHDEIYLMNQPNVYCRGILFGKLRYELGDNMIIKCPKLHLEANIEFKVKGIISGVYDAIDGKISDTRTGEQLYGLTGKWNDIMEIQNLRTGSKEIFYDTNRSKVYKPKVRPLDEQLEIESNKLWGPTIRALSQRDHELATEEKSKVENKQRELAKIRQENGNEFSPKLFHRVDKSDSVDGTEYVFSKNLNLEDEAEHLKSQLFEVMPFLPGQNFKEDFEVPTMNRS